ncbi:TonB family protein [Candidatus Poribacteria bacterium]|nr:TonB family protein [Candidatus Poribacteria bacterium]
MNEISSGKKWIIVIVLLAVGVLNVVLGIMAVVEGARPTAEAMHLTPTIKVGSIIFGLAMLIAGALWVTSAIGYVTSQVWASALALYVCPAIVAVNVIGVLGFWGFNISIGYAAVSTVTGVGAFSYISRKELASFFILAIAENVVVIAILAILIYGAPADTAEMPEENEIIVTIEEIEEEQQPLMAEIIPQNKTVAEKAPTLPKIEIQSVTDTAPGSEIEDSMPQLPKTLARVSDKGSDMVLRSATRSEREVQPQDNAPAINVDSALDSTKKPVLEIGRTQQQVKDGPRSNIARPPNRVESDVSYPEDRVGPSDEVAKPSFAGEITGDIAGRKVVFWPKLPEGYQASKGGTTIIKLWVNPAGYVTNVKVVKKSGSPRLDTLASNYVEQIRFEALPKNYEQKEQYGEIPINFELTSIGD